jgi:hypothetical protein
MRYAVLLVCLAGCTRSNGLSIGGDGGGGGSTDMAAPPEDLFGIDLRGRDFAQPPSSDLSVSPADLAVPPICYPVCNHCTTGGACCAGGPNGCCAMGEWCDANGQCRCGQNAACPSTNPICAAGGAVGGNMCGFICCGGTSPCPL